MSFHEFNLVLSRLAIEIAKPEDRKDPEKALLNFYSEILNLRRNSEVRTSKFPNIGKKIFRRIEDYYKFVEDEENRENNENI